MAELFKHYFYIAFLMGKPQDLPAGERQLQIAVLLNLFTYIAALLQFTTIGLASLNAVMDIACSALLIYLALNFTDRLPRFQQAFGGLCGASAILNIVAIPVLSMNVPGDDGQLSSFSRYFMFLLLVWSLSLGAHVLRHTFELRIPTSILISLAYYIFISALLGMIMPQPAVDAAQISAVELPKVWYGRA